MMKRGGAEEDRTPDLLRARQALSQLSYGPSIPPGNTPAQSAKTSHCQSAGGSGWI